MMNSGSEANSVGDRLLDIHTGDVLANLRSKPGFSSEADLPTVKCIALKGCFHGRTYRPALWTDACRERYKSANVYSIQQSYQNDYCWVCDVNSVEHLERLFKRAKEENVFIEAMFLESVMGEGNPGVAIQPEFYKKARELTLAMDGVLLVDNIQAGLRATGNLSIVDYPGFEELPPPDFEVYSKALNGGQYPISCLALSERAQGFYRHGVYGNTMTGNPRACLVATAVLNSITDELRKNIVDMGKYALEQYKKLQKNEFPDLITNVTGTGLLYAVQLNDKVFSVVAADGAELILRKQGLGVIHGGHNALRFTPHFAITKAELDMQIDFVRGFLKRLTGKGFRELMPRLNNMKIAWGEDSHNNLSTPLKGPTVNKIASNSNIAGLSADSLKLHLRGHLFDETIFNQVLDLIEKYEGKAKVASMRLGLNNTEESEALVEVMAVGENSELLKKEIGEVKGVTVQT